MYARIEVKDREEAELIRKGLDDAAVRAFVKVMAALKVFGSDRAKIRVLRFVKFWADLNCAGGDDVSNGGDDA